MALIGHVARIGTIVTSASFAIGDPPPPQIPRDFQWEGRYFVKDLGVDVSFSWQGSDGDMQMTAGSEDEAIHFTNLIYHDQLYTLTYKWDKIVPPRPIECVCLGTLPLETLNQCLSSSRFVGAEFLARTRHPLVNHFRVGVVFGASSVDPAFRFPVIEGDIYVDGTIPAAFARCCTMGIRTCSIPRWMNGLRSIGSRTSRERLRSPMSVRRRGCPSRAAENPLFQQVFSASEFG